MSSIVSAHAVFRWLTRVRGLSEADIVAITGPAAEDYQLAEAGCRLIGITMAEAREAILPRALAPFVAIGCAKIRRQNFTLLCESRIVATVIKGGGSRSARLLRSSHLSGRRRSESKDRHRRIAIEEEALS